MAEKNWIKSSIKHPGALTRQAKQAGMSVSAFAQKNKHAPGKTGARARLAITFERQARQKKQGM